MKKQDLVLASAIERIGMIARPVYPDLFSALVRSIISQQVSSKAAATVWGRVLQRFGPLAPDRLSSASLEDIQQCGLSMRKAGYIHGIADAVQRGELNLAELPGLADEAVIERLSALPGIGVWTAEMLMIFSLQRPDVVSWGDLAIRRGMVRLYGYSRLDRATFTEHRKRYSPHGSVASLYLWHIAVEG